jgi:hypothetical protein
MRLEYGKDVWMKDTLPTQHVLCFGTQAKRGKLDSSGVTKSGHHNVAEIHNQLPMIDRPPDLRYNSKAQPDPAPGPGGYPEPLRGDQPASGCRCLAAG